MWAFPSESECRCPLRVNCPQFMKQKSKQRDLPFLVFDLQFKGYFYFRIWGQCTLSGHMHSDSESKAHIWKLQCFCPLLQGILALQFKWIQNILISTSIGNRFTSVNNLQPIREYLHLTCHCKTRLDIALDLDFTLDFLIFLISRFTFVFILNFTGTPNLKTTYLA